uniref:ABC transporter domain-containing protein n=1 Tax=Chromera velia CCMP2878 TaxID=1169474 RepID=A0A0G4HGP6_9ALVE|eukprot:Cvel_6779.t1-p1 / transcript=Cvel_6779.t1 / gene=Cvel_6779 / organism=Chromera_velia_CCMP2878 / gene_product=ABC transporter C family member 13, putative / transcript_product=ABC transporter C family member 13, putative / location=Cvel_scaffold340:59414-69842(-) / protein_length=1670 / sequence_SO=supercontig / SO=protein_coding / is_pseudo=false
MENRGQDVSLDSSSAGLGGFSTSVRLITRYRRPNLGCSRYFLHFLAVVVCVHPLSAHAGTRRQLELSDCPGLSQKDIPENSSRNFERRLEEERKREMPSLVAALHSTFALQLYPLSLALLVKTVIGFGGPLLLKRLLEFAEHPSRETFFSEGVAIVVAMSVLSLVIAVADAHIGLSMNRLSMRVRSAVMTALFLRTLQEDGTGPRGEEERRRYSGGEINNFANLDTDRISGVANVFNSLWNTPLELLLALGLLWREVDWAFTAGVAYLLVVIALNAVIVARIAVLTKRMMGHKDRRLKLMGEALEGIQSVKMLGLEGYVHSGVKFEREREMKCIAGRKYLGGSLPPSRAFTALSLLLRLIGPMNSLPWTVNAVVEARISLLRVYGFLFSAAAAEEKEREGEGESLRGDGERDAGLEREEKIGTGRKEREHPVVLLEDAVFRWNRPTAAAASERAGSDANTGAEEGSETVSGEAREGGEMEVDLEKVEEGRSEEAGGGRSFKLGPLSLRMDPGKLVFVFGAVGTGKSSFLHALLGELLLCGGSARISGISGSALSMRSGESSRIAFCSQSPWLRQASLKENVIFGLPFCRSAFDCAVAGAGLKEDVDAMTEGENQKIGEGGGSLSGGQKSRVALARALYANLVGGTASEGKGGAALSERIEGAVHEEGEQIELTLLDAPLAAVDARVGRDIWTAVFEEGGILEGKSVVMATHRTEVVDRARESKSQWLRSATIVVLPHQGTREACVVGSVSDPRVREAVLLLRHEDEARERGEKGEEGAEGTGAQPSSGRGLEGRGGSLGSSGKSGGVLGSVVGVEEKGRGTEEEVREGTWTDGQDSGKVKGTGIGEKETESESLENAATPSPPSEEETRERGFVDLRVHRLYVQAVSVWLVVLTLVSLLLMQGSKNASDFVLSWWSDQNTDDPEKLTARSNTRGSDATVAFSRLFFGRTPDTERLYSGDSPSIMAEEFSEQVTDARRLSSDSSSSVFSFSSTGGLFELEGRWLFLALYVCLGLFNSLVTLARAFLFAWGGVRAARRLHDGMLRAVLGAPQMWFTKTPAGRILNRFTADVWSLDDSLPFMLNIALAQSVGLLGTLAVLAVSSPWVLLGIPPLGCLHFFVQRYFRWSSRELKRLESVTKSPIFINFSETAEGRLTIRAFGREDFLLVRQFDSLTDSQTAAFAAAAAGCWLSLRLELIGTCLTTLTAGVALIQSAIAVFGSPDSSASSASPKAGLVGLSIGYALPLVGTLNGLIQYVIETEKQMIAVERVHEYVVLESEESELQREKVGGRELAETGEDRQRQLARDRMNAPEAKDESELMSLEVPAGVSSSSSSSWPTAGAVSIEGLTVRFEGLRNAAIRDVTIRIRGGERVGIVGRTGAGKSTLLAALFRMVPWSEGRVCIDSVPLDALPLRVARQAIAAVPQKMLVFASSGRSTLRTNADPLSRRTDEEVEEALRQCQLGALIDRLPMGIHTRTLTQASTEGQKNPSTSSGKREGKREPNSASKQPQQKESDASGVRDRGPEWARRLQRGSQRTAPLLPGGRSEETAGGEGAKREERRDSDGGVVLSFGEQQLLCLCRAMLSGAKVIVLDEVSQSIDQRTDALIQKSLEESAGKPTVISVSHSLHSVMNFGRVLVLDRGEVIEDGPPRVLARQRESVFRELCLAQHVKIG